jgi:AraC-like DNA-binding protein
MIVTDEDLYYRTNLYRRIVQAKLFIDANFNSKINVDHIADEAHFSKFHFIRIFKEIYGLTPHQYLIRVRIEHAKKFLSNGMPVVDVCDAVGFESVSTFTGLFKRKVGLSPSTYKKEQLRLKIDRVAQPFKYVPACHIHALMH